MEQTGLGDQQVTNGGHAKDDGRTPVFWPYESSQSES
jgi:hypothetical protein